MRSPRPFGADHSAIGGGRGVSELMDLAPPGIDELFGILEVADLLTACASAPADAGRYDLIVIDTAPTGHALRLLEMPDAAREWVQVLLRVLLKYRTLVRPGQLAGELVKLSKSIRALQTLLHDPVAARFIVVTRAGAVPRARNRTADRSPSTSTTGGACHRDQRDDALAADVLVVPCDRGGGTARALEADPCVRARSDGSALSSSPRSRCHRLAEAPRWSGGSTRWIVMPSSC